MLALHARLRFGSYDAASDTDPRRHEWPPHPARVFCALVASDPSAEEWLALEWLEQQPPPRVLASPELDRRADEMFVPTNEVVAKSPNLPGRTNGSRTKPRCLPALTTFHLVWPSAEPNPAVRTSLDRLAARVPYLGRSTSSAEIWFSTDPPGTEGLIGFEPAEFGAELDLRAPYSGYCQLLRQAHDRGGRAWEVSRAFGYGTEAQDSPSEALETFIGPFGRLLAFRFSKPVHLHASQTVQVAERLRAAVMDLVPDPLPSVVSGHGTNGQTHVAYLAFPNVGSPGRLPHGPALAPPARRNTHADGRLLGVGLALPTDNPDLPVLLHRALISGSTTLTHLRVGGATLSLAPSHLSTGALGAQAARWTRPSAVWATATPLVFDRFPKRNDAAQMVINALLTAGYPTPEEVVTSSTPILPGGPSLARSSVRRRAGVPAKPSVHAWVRFPQPVRGPVLAGSMRYRGLGLFAPIDIAEAPAPESSALNP